MNGYVEGYAISKGYSLILKYSNFIQLFKYFFAGNINNLLWIFSGIYKDFMKRQNFWKS